MSAQIIAVVNQKGGTGKTTTVQTLAAALSLFHGKRVLVVDADAQGSLTIATGVDQDHDFEFADALSGTALDEVVITGVGSGYDLIPGGDKTAVLERDLHGLENLSKVLQAVSGDYDYILIDCAPSLSVVTLNAINAADEVMVTVVPHYLNVAATEKMLDTMDALAETSTGAKRTRLLFTLADNTKVSKEMMRTTRDAYPDVFKTIIRRNVKLAEAPGFGLDVYQYNKGSNGAKDYKILADEIVND